MTLLIIRIWGLSIGYLDHLAMYMIPDNPLTDVSRSALLCYFTSSNIRQQWESAVTQKG